MSSSDAAESGFTATLRRLPSAQKTAKGAPAYSRFVNRRAGGYLAVLAYRVGATPNQVTAVSALCTFAGITGVLLLPPSWPLGIAVSLALVLGYALDSADGQLARLRGTSSVSGEWLDHVIDSAKIATLHVAVLVSAFRFSELPTAWLLVPIAYGAVESVMFFAMILNDQLRRVHRATTGTRAPEPGHPSTLRSLLVVPTDYGLLCLVFLLLGSPAAFAAGYGVLFTCNALFLVAALPKWFGDMRSLDPVAPGRGR
ncbi:CDP-alcohol phosphatidyltransferase family protein [Saccharopolyspora erythraea]|uniref:CDP-alcohol phosphatidyltransferase family protein n=1 Tax=Saccharopolyspora erythraea TaxID=1836 RepID=UPI001BA71620|nr:CDP-alcohol phosphatidyltransferase family protein [Saccharopolyspora erythraea]QUH03317.1 CDP-alcohol phosphatidyltransferase family protein [Saccharopolyspora erythraea]